MLSSSKKSLLPVVFFSIFLTLIYSFSCPASSSSGGGGDIKSAEKAVIIKSIEVVNGWMADDGIIETNDPMIVLYLKLDRNPSHYIICEEPKFIKCEWQNFPYSGRVSYVLSEGVGIKKIYFRAKFLGVQGPVKTLTVRYTPK